MNATVGSSHETNPVLLYLTSGGDNKMLANTTFNLSGNVTSNDMEVASDSGNYSQYILYNVTMYISEHLWFVMIFGVPGNIASIFTIMSMSTVSSSKAHVAILALTDTLAIASKVVYWQVSNHALHLTAPGCAFIMYIQQISTSYANWIVVAMTTERFLAVWFPLRVGRIYTRRKAFIVLACLALATSCLYAFFFWSWNERHELNYGYWCEMKPEFQTFLVRFYWVEGLYWAVLPILFIVIGNVLIITNIKRARKAQRHLTNAFDQGGRKSRDQRQITVMLIVVSLVFLLLNLPNAVFYFFRKFWVFEEPSYEEVKFMFTARLIHLLADANHAVNFYLYFLSMSSFRRRFLDAIRCRRYMRRHPAGSSMSRTSQTYIHSGHHVCDPSRLDNSSSYSAYKRSSSKFLENVHPLKSLTTSNNNRTNLDHQSLDQRNGIDSASSEV
ncbi:hypothetical protein BsWGS_06654 [Bradybaena similaris]